jgi:hypothetical protein
VPQSETRDVDPTPTSYVSTGRIRDRSRSATAFITALRHHLPASKCASVFQR